MKTVIIRLAWISLSVYTMLFIAAGVNTGEWDILFFIVGFIVIGSVFLGTYYKHYPPRTSRKMKR